MKASFTANVSSVCECMSAMGCIGHASFKAENDVAMCDVTFNAPARDAGEWFGKRVCVTVETMGDER